MFKVHQVKMRKKRPRGDSPKQPQNWKDYTLHVLIPESVVQAEADKLPEDSALAIQLFSSNWGKQDWIDNLAKDLAPIGCKLAFRTVSLNNFKQLFREQASYENMVVLNFCDGTEVDTFPGKSVVEHLSECGVPFTGADSNFYEISDSKVDMKVKFDAHKVPQSPWCPLLEDTQECREKLAKLKFPVLCKPNRSYDSCGITLQNLVYDPEAAISVAKVLEGQGYQHIFAEEFIVGREFTCFVFGDASYGLETSVAVERIFDPNLPKTHRFIDFSAGWPTHIAAPEDVQDMCQNAAMEAYLAVGGQGYGRVDMRLDEETNVMKVLEVNANPGLGSNPETCAFGVVLKATQTVYSDYIQKFMSYALHRQKFAKSSG